MRATLVGRALPAFPLLAASLLGGAPAARPAEPPLLVVLQETGGERDGLPVHQVHPDGQAVARALSRGLSGRLLRLFRSGQLLLHREGGPPVEPAYLLLSGNQGGFPRFGFFLGDEDKRHAGYVDLHRDMEPSGRFGALDQIFPHELAHVLAQQLAGPPAPGGSNQVHALGVRTDPVIAFHEGFAEHFQVMAVDDPDADPATARLAGSAEERSWAERKLSRYRSELSAWWSPAARGRMTFPLWYSRAEQILRYHAVKANAFAREVEIPEHLVSGRDLYRAYLLENIFPGPADSPPRTAARMLSTEGVVSALFVAWARDAELRGTYRDGAFYEAFGRSRDEVDGLDNLYLKILHVFHARSPRDTAGLIRTYAEEFPEDAARLRALVRETFLGQPLPAAPEIWLANRDFETGTTVFDQFRAAPRAHTFDLNAASIVDLLAVEGVDRALAAAMERQAPYASLEELRAVPGLDGGILERFEAMAVEMGRLGSAADDESEAVSLLGKILGSYGWRALGFAVGAGLVGAVLYRLASGRGVLGSAAGGLAAALIGLPAAWLVESPGGSLAILVPLFVFGVPGALWKLLRTRSAASASRVLIAWAAAGIPGALLATPLGGEARPPVTELASPAGPGSGEPGLASADGTVVLSWLEARRGGGAALRISRWDGVGWSAPATVAAGPSLLVNWADFPSVLPMRDGTLVAHWLEKREGAPHAYGIRLSWSRDAGLTWAPAVVLDRDGLAVEHGFVSLLDLGPDRVGAAWLGGRSDGTALLFSVFENGAFRGESVLDARVCDCCQTAAATTAEGPFVAYRDRSADEVRDVGFVRASSTSPPGWTEPAAVHPDGWRIDGCPVNGPAVAADGERLAIVWFTEAAGGPRVLMLLSRDSGRTLTGEGGSSRPIRVDEGRALGRVDVEMLPDGSAAASWVEATEASGAAIRARRVGPDGRLDPPLTVAPTTAARGGGFPRMARARDGLLVAWTDAAEPPRVRVARLRF